LGFELGDFELRQFYRWMSHAISRIFWKMRAFDCTSRRARVSLGRFVIS
jgi:hypothetical protein